MPNDREKLRKIIKKSGLYIFANSNFTTEQADCEVESLISAILELEKPLIEALEKVRKLNKQEWSKKDIEDVINQALDQTGKCSECKGTGVTPDKKPYEGTCPKCNGTGAGNEK